ncbi:unnamed protein product [Rotaria sordida]|uniref:Uncharacterized protein n=1 Tax=Rotaria sordida TaxID=392033 RepID=A0A819DW75_9BILA|nr:unnamed protein product [Rotaria sordida]CAF0997696.1 unnamed protein product [Rotaria sordida]CAF1064260.1 unnamed protein product [Rotaria sordida]CAF1116222.1 unnamed protein product [Rotaria sordida]CAF1250153.1 unnamed protein product [Rotaria sordida]
MNSDTQAAIFTLFIVAYSILLIWFPMSLYFGYQKYIQFPKTQQLTQCKVHETDVMKWINGKFQAIWTVNFNDNESEKRSKIFLTNYKTFTDAVEAAMNQYKIGQVYECYFNIKKPYDILWTLDDKINQFFVTTFSSTTSAGSSSHLKRYTSEMIEFLLQQQTSKYAIIKNEKTNTSLCWKVFNYPTKKSKNIGEFERIEGFASCQMCYQRSVYTSTTGTRNMLTHSCVKKLSNTKITTFTTNSSSSSQIKIISMMNNYKQTKLNEKELNFVENLVCSWICYHMRPFRRIVNDNK